MLDPVASSNDLNLRCAPDATPAHIVCKEYLTCSIDNFNATSRSDLEDLVAAAAFLGCQRHGEANHEYS